MSCEETSIIHLEAILAEQEPICGLCLFVVNLCGKIDSQVFDAKVLNDLLALLVLHIHRFLGVDYTEDAIVLLRNDKGGNSPDAEVEVIDDITL